MDAGLRDMFPHTVTIAPFVSEDEYRKPSYDTPFTNLAYVIQEQRRITGPKGEERWSSCTVELFGAPGVKTRDQITLPDGTTPTILYVETLTDPDGGQLTHEVLYT